MTDEPQSDPTGYAKARERFLREAFPEVLKAMEKAGTLGDHLEETAFEAEQLFETIVGDIRAQTLKSEEMPYLKKVQALEQAPIVASEIVMAEVILVPPATPEPSPKPAAKPKRSAKPGAA